MACTHGDVTVNFFLEAMITLLDLSDRYDIQTQSQTRGRTGDRERTCRVGTFREIENMKKKKRKEEESPIAHPVRRPVQPCPLV
jgi:hypothetical protein